MAKIVSWDSSYSSSLDFELISECCLSLTSRILARHYLIDDIEKYLADLFKNQEVQERLSFVLNHKSFVTNVLGDSPKLIFNDWKNGIEKIQYVRNKEFIPRNTIKHKIGNKKVKGRGKIKELNEIPHNKRKVISIIDNNLWDKAGWKGAGVVPARDGVGLIIGFENIDFGEKIFKDWIERYGIEDKPILV